MQPEINLGPLTLQSFGLMMGLGFVVAGVFASKRLKEIGRPADWAYEMVFAALVGGIVGARLWSVIENWDEAKVDVAAVPLAAAYAIGRIGCQLAGDGDYGEAWDGPWAMAYPEGTVPTTEEVHPTPVYETLTMGLVAWFLWSRRHRHQPGVLFALYLVLAGTERLLVEFVRRNRAGVG